ncbi:MAG: hypothetical protein AAF633_27065, partial [Chloroflexota bacterium]
MRLLLNGLLAAVSLLFISTVGPLSIWMLVNAPTWIGVLIALLGLSCLSLLCMLSALYVTKSLIPRRWQRVAAGNGLIIVLLGAFILFSAPTGIAPLESPIQQHFANEGRFRRFAISNIVPEAEQINLGYLLMTYADPILTAEQAETVSKITRDLYADMDADPNFYALGSTMGLAYNELIGLPYGQGHYYLYTPQTQTAKPLPAILFLHGSVGNFKPYSYVWSQLAEEEGIIIIAPSYGFGN